MVEHFVPSIILLQETMDLSETIKKDLEKCLPGWCFEAMDPAARSGGVAIGWRKRHIQCDNIWGIHSGIGADFFSREENLNLSVLKIYVLTKLA